VPVCGGSREVRRWGPDGDKFARPIKHRLMNEAKSLNIQMV